MKRLLFAVVLSACGAATSTPLPDTPASPPPPPPPARPSRAIEESPHLALGLPRDADDSDDLLLDKGEYVVSYNPRLNAANWAAWRVVRADLGHAGRSPAFRSDEALPRNVYVVKDADYHGSGYDRGHLCPSADRTSSPAVNATTFVFTNAHPQVHELNAGPWEDLEKHERELAKSGKDVYIVAGGLFDREPPRIGHDPDASHRVAVPRASFKVIVALEHGQRAEDVSTSTPTIAVVMPNSREATGRAWTDYKTTIHDVERQSGYDFDARVPRATQEAIETRP
jgi:endonuclease G